MNIKFFNSVASSMFVDYFIDELRKEHNVVYTCALNTAYKQSNSHMTKLLERWQMYGGFGIKSVFEARGQQALSIVTTNPFFNPCLISLFSRNHSKTINLLWDLFPDALELAGFINRGSFFSKILEKITSKSLDRCSATVFLGNRLKKHVESRYGQIKNSTVIPVGADGREFRAFPPIPLNISQQVNFLYSGNFGRMHDLDTLYEAINRLDKKVISKLSFRFNSYGIKYNKLCERFKNKPNAAFILGTRLPRLQWINIMKESHVGIVSMIPGAEKIVMPSKTYSSLVAGQAILAICPYESDLADLVFAHDCGWVVEPGDIQGLMDVLINISLNHDDLLQKRRNAFEAGHKYYDIAVVVKDWLDLIKTLEIPPSHCS